jgi:RHS repeat-associated protein
MKVSLGFSFFFSALIFQHLGFAQTKQLATETISLPTAPGSIDGLGESFEPQLNTGSYIFQIPLKLPPVRGRVQPEVSMTYNSGTGNGPLGLGWSFRVPSLQRQTDKGLPRYDSTDTYVTGDGAEIMARADGTYRAEVEKDFTKWENLGGQGWRATRRDGSVLSFGGTAQARLERAPGQVFRWMLESAQDTNGNRVEYSYFQDAGQIYLQEIRFGLHAGGGSQSFRLVFEYDSNRPERLADYRGRFRSETRLRLRSATLALGQRRVRHWAFDYEAGNPLTSLSKFTVSGDQRTTLGAGAVQNVDYLPPLEFDYSPSQLGEGAVFVEEEAPEAFSLGAGDARLVDLNRDGLPDVVHSSGGKYHSMANLGPGRGFGPLEEFSTPAYYPALTNSSARLADLLGDGNLRMLVDEGGGELYTREITSATTVGPAVDFSMPGMFPLSDPAIQTVDINNDRAMDFMAVDGDRFSFAISGAGRGPNFFHEKMSALAEGIRFADGWQFADMNGDRMPDLVAIATRNGGGVVFHPGMGWGDFDEPVEMAGGPADADLGSRSLKAFTLVDLDGDGLSDLVQVESGLVRVWPNRSGKEWGEAIEISEGVPEYLEGGTFVTFQDMNGNGSTDIVWNDPARGFFLRYLELHPATKPNLLVEMRNGMGRRMVFEYRSSTDYRLEAEEQGNPWTAVPPFPVPVVSAFTEYDGMGSTYRTEISYRNAYYDGAEREFRGFERAVQTEVGNGSQGAPSLVTRFDYHTGEEVEALKGMPKATETATVQGSVFWRTETEWNAKAIPGAAAEGESRGCAFPVKTRETTHILEGGVGQPVTLLKEFDYDDHGNEILAADYGRVEGENRAAWNDERIVKRSFTASHSSGISRWILGLPVSETIEDLSGRIAAQTLTFYDDEGFSGGNAGQVDKGNPTLVRRAVDPATGVFIDASRKTYDAFGNPIALIDPLGTGPGAPHSRTIAYDSEIHTHPVSETIHVGGETGSLLASATYDTGLGVMTSSTEFNGHATMYSHDPFGRLVAATKPRDSADAPTESYSFQLGMPLPGGRILNWIETRKRESAGGGTVDSRTFFDGLGRKIMTRAEGERGGQIVVSDTVVFNDRRTEWKKYLPYFDGGSLAFADPSFSTPFQEIHYDSLGRVVRADQPATDGGSRPFAETVYEPLAKTVRDEEQTSAGSPHAGAAHRFVEDGLRNKDGAGRLRFVEEIVKVDASGQPTGNIQTWKTSYSYDTLDNWTGYTDSRGNRKSLLYDGLSRKVFMSDPDRGPYWWAYDAAGNVVRTCDAKNQHIALIYDGANRPLAEWHISANQGGSSPGPAAIWSNPPGLPGRDPDVRFTYDTPPGPQSREAFWRPAETKGMVNIILDRAPAATAADANKDGKLDVRDVAMRSSSPAQGTSVTAQNTAGRLVTVRDQVGEEHFSYDARGRAVWKIRNFDRPQAQPLAFYTENTFDSMDRLVRHVYADGTAIEYRYNSRGLLESVDSAIDSVDYNPSAQNLVVSLANGITSTYEYDQRLRLKRLVSRRGGGTALQDRNFSYDAVSNITGISDGRSLSDRSAILSDLGNAASLAPGDLNDSLQASYDSLYRMVEASGPSLGSHSYRFDPIGNLLKHAHSGDARFRPPGTGTLSYGGSGKGPHMLTGVNSGETTQAIDYDANGNTVADGRGASMQWDPKDRMIASSENGVMNVFAYDHSSRRAVHTATKNGVETARTYYVDDVSEFRDGRLVKYIYVGKEKVARADFSASSGEAIKPDTFYLHDHLGSGIVATDGQGKVRQISSYTPYGHDRFRGLSPSAAIDYGFSGKELHASPDLAYFETRFLSSAQGRFTQADTLALDPPEDWRLSPQNWNSYSYCRGSPLSLVDLDGKAPEAMMMASVDGAPGHTYEPTTFQIDSDPAGVCSFADCGSYPVIKVEASSQGDLKLEAPYIGPTSVGFELDHSDPSKLTTAVALGPIDLTVESRNGNPTSVSLGLTMEFPTTDGGTVSQRFDVFETLKKVNESFEAYDLLKVRHESSAPVQGPPELYGPPEPELYGPPAPNPQSGPEMSPGNMLQ